MSENSSIVCAWNLRPSGPQPAESAFTLGHNTEGSESSLADDSRTAVNDRDIQPGGKYYSIVKLQIRFEQQATGDNRWAQGTGWLIKPNVLITAGHCAFDHSQQLGRAAAVKCWVGYKGKASVNKPGVQFRQVTRILTTSGWLKSGNNRENDVSFMVLERPFEHVTPINWQATPTSANLMLGVVGYPADKSYEGEMAAQMYEQYKTVPINLELTGLNMLEYTISSYGGQSGSPVLVQNQNTAIGTHVYGLGVKNAASVIRGKYGNFYRSYLSAIESNIPQPQPGRLWTILNVPPTEEAALDTRQSEAEGFWDTLKQVVNVGAKVGSTVIGTASPFFGPIGGPVSALVGGALGVLGKVTESAMDDGSNMPGNISPSNHQDLMCRGIAAEAALDTVLRMDKKFLEKHGIIDAMMSHYNQNKDLVPALAQQITPAVLGSAVRLAANTSSATGTDTKLPVLAKPTSAPEQAEGWFDVLKGGLSLAGSLLQKIGAESTMEVEETEGFFDILNIALQVAPVAAGAIGKIISTVRGESTLESADDMQPHIQVLCHRAIMGEAALQALMKIPPAEAKQEGFFGDLYGKVKEIGASVLKVAPSIIRVVEPIAHQLIQQQLNPGSTHESGLPTRSLRPTKSAWDVRDSNVSAPPSGTAPPLNGGFTSPGGFTQGGFQQGGFQQGGFQPVSDPFKPSTGFKSGSVNQGGFAPVPSGFSDFNSSGFSQTGFRSTGFQDQVSDRDSLPEQEDGLVFLTLDGRLAPVPDAIR